MVIRRTVYSNFIAICIIICDIICKSANCITKSNMIANTQQKMKKNKLYFNDCYNLHKNIF